MNIENTKAQMRKGVLEFCILSVLKEKEAYTSEILDTLKNAKLLEPLKKYEYEKLVSASDVGLVFLHHDCLAPNYPSRILTYMQSSNHKF